VNYRFATTSDLPKVNHLMWRYLCEQEASGSPVRATKHTLDAYRDLARAYLAGGMFGVVVLAEKSLGDPVGFALAGEDVGRLRYDTTLGKVAFVWLIWVTYEFRKSGTALGMLTFGRPRLLELGFETASMSVRENNPEGQALTLAYGGVLAEREYLFALSGTPAHLQPPKE